MLDVVITTDRTMMTNHHRKEFLGFFTTAPPVGLPERAWMWLSAPKPKVDRLGRPIEAPYGLRKIEAKLQEAGFNAAIIDPDHLDKYLKSARLLMVGHHDYFAMNSPSVEWWAITGEEPVNSRSFKRLMRRKSIREAKRNGLKIIAGGPAAWQWLWRTEYWREFGVDTVIDGEAERVIVDITRKALEGEELPAYLYVGPEDAPSIDEIPEIKGASVNGFVEIMRGCPRRCRFCPVTLRPVRYYPLEKIEKELQVNVKAGIRSGVLHSEDVLLYGARGIEPNPDAILKLHTLVKKYYRTVAWSHVTLAGVKYAEEKYRLITNLTEILYDEHQDWLGVQVGLETGSRRLARIIMPGKAAPYPIEKWHEVVGDALAIMHDNRIVPALTLILGVPGETEEDLIETSELIDNIKDYRSLIVPMFFVPLGYLKDREGFIRDRITEAHLEVMWRALNHSLRWGEDIAFNMYLRSPKYLPVRILFKAFLMYVKARVRELERVLDEKGPEALLPSSTVTKNLVAS
ncbi:MAG: B12-binding domain-containing radical SAM protein [Infirmifilum uzonense]|uniref:B12-binding domain-containing radical SAM protein n=1 Tax=Infirmifilum uzonense TaxID=1550241 RepID=UPI003C76A55C